MLKAFRMRDNQFKVGSDDVYIGHTWREYNGHPLACPKNWDLEHYYKHLKLNDNPNSLLRESLDWLRELYLKPNNWYLIGWDLGELNTLISYVRDSINEASNAPISDGLTSGQRNALKVFKSFLNGGNETMLLTGGGGVGKSYVMGKMIEMVEGRAIILSPKHKIKKLHNDKNVLENCTYQSFLGIKPNRRNVNDKTGIIPYEIISPGKTLRKVNEALQDCDVVFVEECSQLEKQVYNYIREYIHCKIVFVGDDAQIPPINEGISKAITDADITVELLEVVRYSGELLTYCQAIRNEIKSDKHCFSFHSQLEDNAMVSTLRNGFKAVETFVARYKGGVDIKLLTYTNAKMLGYNEMINGILFEDEISQGLEYFVGQKLIANGDSKTYRPINELGVRYVKDEPTLAMISLMDKFDEILVSGVDFGKDTVLSGVGMRDEVMGAYFEEFKSLFDLDKGYGTTITDNRLISLLMTRFTYYFITGVNEVGVEINVRVLADESKGCFNTLLGKLHDDKDWLLKDLLLSLTHNLQPSLSLTIDQSQGSTYEEVILDCDGVKNLRNINRYYVGISRGKNHLYLLN